MLEYTKYDYLNYYIQTCQRNHLGVSGEKKMTKDNNDLLKGMIYKANYYKLG